MTLKKKKSKTDPRHKQRQKYIQNLFSWEINPETELLPKNKKVIAKKEKLDQIIKDCAPKWPLEKINKIDLAILRLSIYEIYYDSEVPTKVAIDEAVELAKEFGAEGSPGFVNGVLGAAYEKYKEENNA